MLKTEAHEFTEEQIRERFSSEFQSQSLEELRNRLIQSEIVDAAADAFCLTHKDYAGAIHGPLREINGHVMVLSSFWRPYSEYKKAVENLGIELDKSSDI